MLIAITSEGTETTSLTAKKFGKSPYIAFYDTEKNFFEFFRNPYVSLFSESGIQTAEFIIKNNAVVVITVDIGLNALRFLNYAEVKVYSCLRKQVNEVAKEFLERKLIEIKEDFYPKFGRKRHHGNNRNWNKGFR